MIEERDIEARLRALADLADKATPGPWTVGEERHAGQYQLVGSSALTRGYVCEIQGHFEDGEADADSLNSTCAFIAASRTAPFREAADEIARLREENERLANLCADLSLDAPKLAARFFATELARLREFEKSQTARATAAEARLAEVEKALENVDDRDWEFVLHALGDGGRARFWKEVLAKLRAALGVRP